MCRFRLGSIISVVRVVTRDVGDLEGASYQQSFLLQQQAQVPRAVAARARLVDDDGVQQAFAAHEREHRVLQAREPVTEHPAQAVGALDHALVADEFEGADGDGAAERVAAVRGPVRAGLDGEHDVLRPEHARHGVHAAGDGFSEQDQVGPDAAPFVAEHLARSSDAGLDLVADEQDVVLVAERAGFLEVVLGGDYDAGLALDGLDQESSCFRAVRFESGAESIDVVVRQGLFRVGTG